MPIIKRIHGQLYFWVLVGIAAGAALGVLAPNVAVQMRPLGDAFIALLKMLIGPVIFATIVLGICGAGEMKKVGRIGAKSLIYFEIVSTLALIIGLIVANVLKPGVGFDVDPATLQSSATDLYSDSAEKQSAAAFLMHLIPTTFVDAFAGSGDLLQVLIVSLLFGFSLSKLGEKAEPIRKGIDAISEVFFGMVNSVMKLAPIGAGGAVAFTIGQYGIGSLGPLLYLMLCFYTTCFLFVFVVLGLIARWAGFSIFAFLSYIREELLTVLGTSSSESALVPLMAKLERLGCSRPVVGLVVPAGYSFNLDGTNIYLTLALLFIAQAMGIELTWTEQASILGMAMISSKGASGIAGAGFITLAATLAVVPKVPVAGMALILGADRFMSEARALTNIIGNGVAALVVSRWEGDLDMTKLKGELAVAAYSGRVQPPQPPVRAMQKAPAPSIEQITPV